MNTLKRVAVTLCSFLLADCANAVLFGPINKSYDHELSILPCRLKKISRTEDISIATVLETLNRLLPDNINNMIENGRDFFNLTSTRDENGCHFIFSGFNRKMVLTGLVNDVMFICKNNPNGHVRKIINGRAIQLLDAINIDTFGSNTNRNFARMCHELRGLQLTQGDVYAYFYPNPNVSQQ